MFIQNGLPYYGYYDYTYKPLYDAKGKIYGVICTAIDVTEEVVASNKLAEAEQNMRGAVELAQLGTWSIDVASNGLTYSDRLIEWFGYDPAAQDYNEVIPILLEEDQQRVANAVAWALNPESGGVYDETYTVIHPTTGKKRILHAQGKLFLIPRKPGTHERNRTGYYYPDGTADGAGKPDTAAYRRDCRCHRGIKGYK